MNDWPYPTLIAHRGAGHLAPENTLAAFKLGYALGFRSFECDVKLSADGVLYLLHDSTLERTTSGIGDAGLARWQTLSQLDAGQWHSAIYAGEPVPLLETIAAFVRDHACSLNIEIKPVFGQAQATGTAVANAVAGLWQGAAVQPLLSSFSETALQAAQAAQPQLARAYLFDAIPNDWQVRLERLGCVGLVCNWERLTEAQVQACKAAEYRVAVYTCNDYAQAQYLLGLGVDSVITDAVDTMVCVNPTPV